MKKALKWLGLGLGGVLLLLVFAGGTLYTRGQMAAKATADEVSGKGVAVAADSAAVERGLHLSEVVSSCTSCHAAGLGGRMFDDVPAALATVAAPNLTTGRGGVGASYSPEDWDRAIRHGVGADGRRMIIMPSEHFQHMSDDDLAALLAYIGTLPPIDNELPARRVGPMGALLVGAGQLPFPADLIDHEAVGGPAPAAGPTAEYGAYLAEIASCTGCHGAGLAGREPGPGPPPAPALVPTLGNWSEEDFFRAIRNGLRPDGTAIDATHMPWPQFARMSDDELSAIWAYARTLPAGAE